MTKHRKRGQDGERDIQIARGVYMLGMIVLPEKLKPTMQVALDEMQANDWVPVPYSLARSMSDTLMLHIRRKLPSVGSNALHVLDMEKGELRLTPLGEMSIKKLAERVQR